MISSPNVGAMIVRVEPLTKARALRGPFDYLVPEGFEPVQLGDLLEIPFGPRRLRGVVVELPGRSDLAVEKLRAPIARLDGGISPELVELARWTAAHYCSTLARTLGLVLPPGSAGGSASKPRRRLLVAPVAAPAAPRLGPKQRAVLAALAEAGHELEASELQAQVGVDRASLRRLAERGLLGLREERFDRRPKTLAIGRAAGPIRLGEEQRIAVDRICDAIDGHAPRELLLHGVTGSGKTEVYIRAAAHALGRGRGTIVLVPEIALTPQAVSRFIDRLGDGVAIIHSGLRPGERADEWRRLREGRARICIGPRSAVFAPVSELGLIVVDEEHDSSYKGDGDPRYDAREVARVRAAAAGAALVLGTATPRPESWREFERVTLSERADGSALPPVELLDMRGRAGAGGPLHSETREALVRLRHHGGRAMVLLNRRGWSPHIECSDCGTAVGCSDCDVSLVMHRQVARLACHHCGHSQPVPSRCGVCGSSSLARHGTGTEQLARTIAELVEPVPVFRLDSDSVGAAGGHAAVLQAFGEAPSGVLVGTQMIAKGHDFADVRLAVVIDADATLRFPDFRSEERTFAMVAQLAGRCGRGTDSDARVLVQTLAPGAGAILAAARHDAAGFLSDELRRREQLGYPPFRSLVSIELGAEDHRDVAAAARAYQAAIAAALPTDSILLGPAPLLRVRNRHRRRLLVKSPSAEREGAIRVIASVVAELAATAVGRRAAVAVDVDPA